MDQRYASAFVAGQQVTVTLLRDPESMFPARVTNAAGRGLALMTSSAVPPGTPLKIMVADSMFLGEAAYCRRQADSWYIGVELNQVLAGLAELGRRLQEYSPAPSGRQGVYALDHRNTQNRQERHQ